MADMIAECMADLKTNDAGAFSETFCQRCRQTGCVRAKWSGDKFGERVSNQMDRLFHSPQADTTSSRYEHLHDFKNLLPEAMRMEISDQRGDWSVSVVPNFDKIKYSPHDDHMDSGSLQKLSTPSRFVDAGEEATDDKTAANRIPEGVPATVVSAPKVGAAQVKTGNTPTPPAGGILLNGHEAVTKPTHDPWSAPAAPAGITVVQRGATVKMGGN